MPSSTPSQETYRMLLTEALGSPHGTSVTCSSPERLRTKLYAVRRKHTPLYDSLSFVVSPASPLTQLWITHNGK